MSRKLVLVNIALVGVLGLAGHQIRVSWQEAEARERAVLEPEPAPVAGAPAVAAEPVAPIQAGSYFDVAEKLLFFADRNPVVVIETPEEKPVPPFPVAHGVMDFGGGATLILSERAGAEQKSYRKGDRIGPFVIASADAKEVVFEFEGRRYPKTIADLKLKEAPQTADVPQGSVTQLQAPAPAPPRPVATKEEIEAAQRPSDGGPGIDVGAAVRACVPGEASPAGTVVGGFRKVITATPFGPSCRWEPVR